MCNTNYSERGGAGKGNNDLQIKACADVITNCHLSHEVNASKEKVSSVEFLQIPI